MLGIVEADNTFDGVRVDVRYERVRTCACGEVRLRRDDECDREFFKGREKKKKDGIATIFS